MVEVWLLDVSACGEPLETALTELCGGLSPPRIGGATPDSGGYFVSLYPQLVDSLRGLIGFDRIYHN